jgi:hypothetical protein
MDLTENEEDWYRILGMLKVSSGRRREPFAEKMDWIPRAPRLSSLYGFGQYDHDGRGFIFEDYPKVEEVYIVAAKVHVRNSLPERIEFLTGWGFQRPYFDEIHEHWKVPLEVKNAAAAYLRDWLGWFEERNTLRE